MSTAAQRVVKRKALFDALFIIGMTFVVLMIISTFQESIYGIIRNEAVPLLPRVLLISAVQLAIAGLGVIIIAILRRESFRSHGLKRKGALRSILLSALCFLPHLLYLFVTGQVTSYLPLQGVTITEEVLSAGFPVNALGMLLIAVAWGFFEGFNYVFICDKINVVFPPKKFLDWGALFCGISCFLVHGAIGVTLDDIAQMLTALCIVYGMLLVRRFTDNAWGSVFVFVFLWNSF